MPRFAQRVVQDGTGLTKTEPANKIMRIAEHGMRGYIKLERDRPDGASANDAEGT